LFKRKTIHGAAAEGWQLLDWRNTRYHPSLRHTLILTPQDENNSGIHLRFFSEDMRSDEPAKALQKSDVRELPREPLSGADMPWPGFVDTSDMSDIIGSVLGGANKRPRPQAPWKDDARSITFSGWDNDREREEINNQIKRMLARYGNPASSEKVLDEEPLFADDYRDYLRTGTEKTIRRTIAHVAAERLMRTPLSIVRELGRQAGQADKETTA
jgi:hypothetical protein